MFVLQNSSNEELEQQCTSHKDCKCKDRVSGPTDGCTSTAVPSATWLSQTALLTTSFTSVQAIRSNGSSSGHFFFFLAGGQKERRQGKSEVVSMAV